MNKIRLFFFVFFALILGMAGKARTAEVAADLQDPARVIHAYLRAIHARDFGAAYRFISAADRKIRDVNRYVQQRGAFSGFTLEVARKLSESVEIESQQRTVAADHAQITVRYRVPDPQKIAPTVLHWDPYRLNPLGVEERRQMIDLLVKKQQEHSLQMSEFEERFELVKEANAWRIFLNWAAGVKIPLKLDVSRAKELEVSLSIREVVLQPSETFEVRLSIRNNAHQAVHVRIGHLVEPSENADYLDFIQCGFLLPVTIPPGKKQGYSGTYMLRGNLPEGIRRLQLTYDFRILK